MRFETCLSSSSFQCSTQTGLFVGTTGNICTCSHMHLSHNKCEHLLAQWVAQFTLWSWLHGLHDFMQIFDVFFSYERVFFFLQLCVFERFYKKAFSYCTDHLLSPFNLPVVFSLVKNILVFCLYVSVNSESGTPVAAWFSHWLQLKGKTMLSSCLALSLHVLGFGYISWWFNFGVLRILWFLLLYVIDELSWSVVLFFL